VPTRASCLLSDAEALLTHGRLEAILEEAGIAPHGLPLLLFGRSMGSNVAIHLAALRPARVAGLVIESGVASISMFLNATGADEDVRGLASSEQGDKVQQEADAAYAATAALLPRAGGGVEHVGLFENGDKLRELAMPTLVLHGQRDQIVPAAHGLLLHRWSAAVSKTLAIIEGAGHNDIAMAEAYFRQIAAFVNSVLE
jgi:pimeloyl-ACP methyl ester carboxylesterase